MTLEKKPSEINNLRPYLTNQVGMIPNAQEALFMGMYKTDNNA
jgi:uracil-DNA glycosylase